MEEQTFEIRAVECGDMLKDRRAYFAGMALQAILSKLPLIDQEGEFASPTSDKIKYNLDVAESAWAFGDAMIAAEQQHDTRGE